MGNETIQPIRPGVNSDERFADRTAPLLLALARAMKSIPLDAVDAIAQALEAQVDTPHDDFDKKFQAIRSEKLSPEDRIYALWMLHIAVFFRRGRYQNLWFGPDIGADLFDPSNEDRLRIGEAMSREDYADLKNDLTLLARIEPGAMVDAANNGGASFVVHFSE